LPERFPFPRWKLGGGSALTKEMIDLHAFFPVIHQMSSFVRINKNPTVSLLKLNPTSLKEK
jgi:hypothetical protein